MRNLVILLLLASAIMACGRGNAGEKAADQEHDHALQERHQLTMFTDSLEFYVEYPALERGDEAEFLVHLTRLSNYKPYAEGSVRITLDFGDRKSSGHADTPVIPGIWLVAVNPEYSGKCSIIFEYFTQTISEKSLFAEGEVSSHHAETHVHDDEAHSHDAEPHVHDAGSGSLQIKESMPETKVIVGTPDGTSFTKEQAWKSDFAVELLKLSSFSGIIKAGGEILAMPGEKYYIHAHNAGIVNYSKKNLVAGGQIMKAEEMMRIEGQGLADGNISIVFAEAETRFLQSRSEYERHLRLFRENAISEKQFIETRSAYITDSIRFYNLNKSYAGGGLKILSPITGHIHELKVSQGEYVEVGQLIATVSSDKRLLLRADVSQQYFARISDIVSANIRTSYHKKVLDIEELEGRLLAIGTSVKENNQYLPVYFEAQNNGELLEGAFAEFFLKTSTRENCILVPVPAVLEEQGRYFVFVQVAGETYQKTEIRPGESDGINYSVNGGLSPGDRVVTKGSMLLKAASMSATLPGHSH